MQLSQLGQIAPKTFTLKDPFTDLETDIKITVHPTKSKHGKEVQHEMFRKVAELMQDEANTIEIDGRKQLNNDLIAKVSYEQWADMIVSWENIHDEKNKQIKFTKDKAIEIFKENPYFVDAIAKFSNDLGNFIEA
jgi:hypothetical protein